MNVLLLFLSGGAALQLPTNTLTIRRARLSVCRTLLPLRTAADNYDLAVIGAGPVGVAGALRAAEQGKTVVLIDAPLPVT